MRFISPLLFFIANATHQQLAQQLQYLKAENEALRARLPKYLRTTPAELAKLIKFGKPVGKAIQGLTSIVHPPSLMLRRNQDHGQVQITLDIKEQDQVIVDECSSPNDSVTSRAF